MKKFALALALAAGLSTAVAPVRKAEAGLIFLPAGVGLFFIIMGVIYDSPLLIILDANGTPTQDSLEQTLAANYSFIGDSAVVADLATAIRTKAASTVADAQGRREVHLDRSQILEILEPTGLSESAPTQVERLISDLG